MLWHFWGTLFLSGLLAVSSAATSNLCAHATQRHIFGFQKLAKNVERVSITEIRFPVIIWRAVLPEKLDSDIVTKFLIHNGWNPNPKTIPSGIQKKLHFHTVHEALAVLSGQTQVEYGPILGTDGESFRVTLRARDLAFHPALVSHRGLSSSHRIRVLGALPFHSGRWELLTAPPTQRQVTKGKTRKLPSTDPVSGHEDRWPFYFQAPWSP